MATKQTAREKGQAGYEGYPVGTIAFYGPDNGRATKVTVGIIPAPQSERAEMRRWFGETGDVRTDETMASAKHEACHREELETRELQIE